MSAVGKIARRAVGVSAIAAACLAVVPVATASAAPVKSATPNPSASARPSATTTSASLATEISSPGEWALALLQLGNWPLTGSNLRALIAWEAAEGGSFTPQGSKFNPLNTTMPAAGATIFNSVGVKNFPDWATGLDATLRTLAMPFYTEIRAALTAGKDPVAVLAAVDASPWGTKFADPAAGLATFGGSLPADFDSRLSAAEQQMTQAAAKIQAAQLLLDSTTGTQAKLEAQYQKMSGPVFAAQQDLNRFTRALYVDGIEPSLMYQLGAVESGDPVAFNQLHAYLDYGGKQQATHLQRSLEVLALVAEFRRQANAAVSSATADLTKAQDALQGAQQDIVNLVRGPASAQ